MTLRSFIVLYFLAIIALAGALVYFTFTEIKFSGMNVNHYQAKCLSNDKYVILQGDTRPYEFPETNLTTTEFMDVKQDLNFYCKYYDQIQPYIQAHINSKNIQEEYQANIAFHKFEESVARSSISRTPALYSLETIRVENIPSTAFSELLAVLTFGLIGFVILQILRMVYLYIAFGQIIWHPFRKPKSLSNM